MKLHVAGTVNRLNVEHRTPNIERRILMTLRFIDFITIEPPNTEPQSFEEWIRFAQSFLIDRMHYSMLDVQCSMFDVHFYLTRHMKLAKGKVSFSIKLAAFQASGWADT